MDLSAPRKRKSAEVSGAKRNTESLVSFYGDDLECEENVSEGVKFTCPCAHKNQPYRKLICIAFAFCYIALAAEILHERQHSYPLQDLHREQV